MAITYGFFNSKNGDRKYNAEQMSQYFKGILSAGVLADVSDGLQVHANGGMSVLVKAGRAFDSKHHWMENDTDYVLELDASSVTLNRIDRIIIRFDMSESNRDAEILVKKGTPATTPSAPTLTRTAEVEEYCLAEIYITKNIDAITQSVITDTRANNNVCGWVTGLIEQVDTSTLYAQWEDAYRTYYNDTTTAFNAWFESIRDLLDENTAAHLESEVEALQENCIRGVKASGTLITPDANKVVDVTLNNLGAVAYEVKASTDFNTITTPGLYTMRNSSTNAPTTGSSHSLIVNKSDTGNYVQQLAIKEGTTQMYIRYGSSSSWSAWKEFSVSGHTHSTSDITSGALPVSRGGTGATTAADARANLGTPVTAKKSGIDFDTITETGIYETYLGANHPGISDWNSLIVTPCYGSLFQLAIPSNTTKMYIRKYNNVSKTWGEWTASSTTGHTHSASDITSGTLPVSRGGTGQSTLTSGDILLGNGTSGITSTATLAVSKGGTGATTAADARTNLGALSFEELTGVDCNTITTPGIYTVETSGSAMHVPGVNKICLIVASSTAGDVYQIALGPYLYEYTYVRSRSTSGTWATWHKLSFDNHNHQVSTLSATSGPLQITKGGTGAISASATADSLLFVSRPDASTICSVYASGSTVVTVNDGWAMLVGNLSTGNNWVASVTTWSENSSDTSPHYVATTIAYSGSIWLKFESSFNGNVRVSYVIFTVQS